MNIFLDVFGGGATVSPAGFFISIIVALILGGAIANVFMYRSNSSKSYALTISMLPVTVCMVVLFVSDNFGAGLAVSGAFALIKFKSEQGSAKELIGIFIAVAAGIGCGTGYVVIATIFTFITLVLYRVYSSSSIWNSKKDDLDRIITVISEYSKKENDLTDVFYSLISKYSKNIVVKDVRISQGKKKKKLTMSYKVTLESKEEEGALIEAIKYSDLAVDCEIKPLKNATIHRL